MLSYAFALVVDGFKPDSHQQGEFFASLDYAAIPGPVNGVSTVEVIIDARTPREALERVSADLASVGIAVVRIDVDLVTVSSMALRLSVSRETARKWTERGRAGLALPAPFTVAGESLTWRWADVAEWAAATGTQLEEDLPLPGELVDEVNGLLACRREAAKVVSHGMNAQWTRVATGYAAFSGRPSGRPRAEAWGEALVLGSR